jgi:hypothetical protein
MECSIADINNYQTLKEHNSEQIVVLKEKLKLMQQIKSKLEAWEVIKNHCDYQDGDRFNCIPEGFYLIEPIKGKDYLTLKKALEVEECEK